MLGGDFVFLKEDLNANGIVAVDDNQSLLVVHTALGTLYRVGPATGYAAGIDLGGAVLRDSSGLAFADGTLYAANFNQCVYAIALDPTFAVDGWNARSTLRTSTTLRRWRWWRSISMWSTPVWRPMRCPKHRIG